TAVSIKTQQEKTFTNADCKFGYRNSILKNGAKGQFVVTSVTFRLTKNHHRLHTSYGTIADELKKNGIARPTLKNISDAVMAIRQRKLPDPSVLGNSGSFFKNPVLGVEDFKKFNKKFPTAPFYEVPPAAFKVPAAWLIEQAGYKGKRFGNAGVHANQALVLVNFGGATGAEIWHLARRVQKAVLEKFNIKIEPEVQVVGKDTQ
ncbi:MAG: UDP-N-acetylenolpyruvoylglucosamine reductase, partial [Marinirhabdus sp.]